MNGASRVKIRRSAFKRRSQKVKKKKSKNQDFFRITMLSGSSWSPIKYFMEFVKGNHDVFVGIEHRLRGDEPSDMLTKKVSVTQSRLMMPKLQRKPNVQVCIFREGFSLLLQITSPTSVAPVDGGKVDSLEEK